MLNLSTPTYYGSNTNSSRIARDDPTLAATRWSRTLWDSEGALQSRCLPVELILIRHALPVRLRSDDGGPADPPLAEAGRAQTERLVGWLEPEPIDVLYASPLRRAWETALPLAQAKGLDARPEPDVVEFDRDASEYIPLEERG